MTIIQAIILGIFQGITEFLPISSSGHLVILQKIFDISEGNLFFTAMLHFGTLLSIFIVYYKDIIKIILESIYLISDAIKLKKIKLDNEYRVLAIMIIIGTIPTGVVGIIFKDVFESFYSNIFIVGIALLITGLLLWIANRATKGTKDASNMKFIDAIIVGIFQGLAIIPGISRSGSTIVGSLMRGFNKKFATKFSFLLALPAILGATILELKDALSLQQNLFFTGPIILGIIVSALTGIIAIKILIRALEKNNLYKFAYYVWALGLMVLISGLLL